MNGIPWGPRRAHGMPIDGLGMICIAAFAPLEWRHHRVVCDASLDGVAKAIASVGAGGLGCRGVVLRCARARELRRLCPRAIHATGRARALHTADATDYRAEARSGAAAQARDAAAGLR